MRFSEPALDAVEDELGSSMIPCASEGAATSPWEPDAHQR